MPAARLLSMSPFFLAIMTVVPVSVTIAVSIAIAAVFRVDAVEHEGHVLQLLVFIEALDVGQLAAVEASGTHHEDCEVGDAIGDAGVGDDADGHVVGYDVVIAFAEFVHEFVEPAVHQQLGGVGGSGTRGDEVEQALLLDDVVERQGGVGEEVGDADGVVAEVVAQRAFADVEVDDGDPFFRKGEATGQVARDERLAGALVERGEGDDLQRPVLVRHERHVGAQYAEGLRYDAAIVLFAFSVGKLRRRRVPVLGCVLVERDFAEERHAHLFLYLLPAVDACVEEEDAEAGYAGDGQPDDDAQQEYAVAVGRHGSSGAVGAVDDAGVVVGHGLREGVLLTLVEQVEVERLFDFLLAFDGEHLLFLAGHGRHAALGAHLTVLGVVALHVEADNHVVHGADDVLLHGAQRVVELLHHGVVFAAVVDEMVALQLGGVVEADLVLDAGVADARVGRYEVALLRGVAQVVLDVTGQAQLRLQFEGVGVVFLRLTHVLAGGGGDVNDLVALLECLQFGLDAAQLFRDDDEAFVDEVGRVDRHLVLVLDGFLVIDGDEHVDDVLGTGRGIVLEREGEDGRLFLFLLDAQRALIEVDHGVQRAFLHEDGSAQPRVVVVVGGRGDEA